MREGDLHITSTEQLKAWNDNPTNDKVFVAEWFYDHIFEELLNKKKYKDARALHNEMVRFTQIYENLDRDSAEKRMKENIFYWDDRASYYFGMKKLTKIFKYDR
jgi:hypothetical protein